MWQTQIQTIEYGLNDAIRIKKEASWYELQTILAKLLSQKIYSLTFLYQACFRFGFLLDNLLLGLSWKKDYFSKFSDRSSLRIATLWNKLKGLHGLKIVGTPLKNPLKIFDKKAFGITPFIYLVKML